MFRISFADCAFKGMAASLALLSIVRALSIDNQLTVIKNDCYERMAIGQRLSPKDVYKTFDLNTVADCQMACTKEKTVCKAFSFGIAAKGNATCELSMSAVKETANLKPIGTLTDTDFDLYIKKLGCTLVIEKSQGSQGYDKPNQDNPNGPSTKPLINSYEDPSVINSNKRPPGASSSNSQDETYQVQTLVSIASGPQSVLHPVHDILVGQETIAGYGGGRPPVRPPPNGGVRPPFRPDELSRPYNDRDDRPRPPSGAYDRIDSNYGGPRPERPSLEGYDYPKPNPINNYGGIGPSGPPRPDYDDRRPPMSNYDNRRPPITDRYDDRRPPPIRGYEDHKPLPPMGYDDRKPLPPRDYESGRPMSRPVGYADRPDPIQDYDNRRPPPPLEGYDQSRPLRPYDDRRPLPPVNGYDERPDPSRPLSLPHKGVYDNRIPPPPPSGYDERPDPPKRPIPPPKGDYDDRRIPPPPISGYGDLRPERPDYDRRPLLPPKDGYDHRPLRPHDKYEETRPGNGYDDRWPAPLGPSGYDDRRPSGHGYDDRKPAPLGPSGSSYDDRRPLGSPGIGYDDRRPGPLRPTGYGDSRPPGDYENRPPPIDRYDDRLPAHQPTGYGPERPMIDYDKRPAPGMYDDRRPAPVPSYDEQRPTGNGYNRPNFRPDPIYDNKLPPVDYNDDRPDYRPSMEYNRPIERPGSYDNMNFRPGPVGPPMDYDSRPDRPMFGYGDGRPPLRRPYRPEDYDFGNRPSRPGESDQRPYYQRPVRPLPNRYGSYIPHPNDYNKPHDNYLRPNEIDRYDQRPYQHNDRLPLNSYDEKPRPRPVSNGYDYKPPINQSNYSMGNKSNGQNDSLVMKPSDSKPPNDSTGKPIVTESVGPHGEKITSIITPLQDGKFR